MSGEGEGRFKWWRIAATSSLGVFCHDHASYPIIF